MYEGDNNVGSEVVINNLWEWIYGGEKRRIKHKI